MTDLSIPRLAQLTVTGQLPEVVRLPTFQVHVATPALLAYLGPRPDAVDGPDLYSTTIVQEAPALALTEAVANDPGLTGEVSEVNASIRLGTEVGFGVGTGVGTVVGAGAVRSGNELVPVLVGDCVRPVVGMAAAVGAPMMGSVVAVVTAVAGTAPWPGEKTLPIATRATSAETTTTIF